MADELCPSCGHRDPEHYVGIYGTKPCNDEWHRSAESGEIALLVDLLDVVEPMARCNVIHGGHPRGFTCLDKMVHAADQAHRYGDTFRSEVLAGDHACQGCALVGLVFAARAVVQAAESGSSEQADDG